MTNNDVSHVLKTICFEDFFFFFLVFGLFFFQEQYICKGRLLHLPTTKHDNDTLNGCQGSWTRSHQSWLLRCLALGRDFLGLASYIAQVVRGSTMTTNSSKLLEHVLLRVSRGGESWDSLGRDWTLDQESLSPG